MRIAEKLVLFLEHKLAHTKLIGAEALSEIRVTGRPEFLSNMMFEIGAALSSPWIASAHTLAFIGAHSYMNGGGYLRDGTFIGRYCSIGRRVTIGAGMHSMSGVSTHPLLSRGVGAPYSKDDLARLQIALKPSRRFTVIENDVWIGDGVVIMPGVNVATGSVVGANSVVTRDVSPYEIVGGSPARLIKRRFPIDVIDHLLKTEYWELPLERLQQMSMHNVLAFIEECADLRSFPRENFETYALEPS